MADPSDLVRPEWLFIMRHAQAARPHEKTTAPHPPAWRIGRRPQAPAEVLTPRGNTEAREVGGTLASVLDDLRRAGYDLAVARFYHERTEAAAATAQALQSAYQQTADAIKTEYGCGPPPLAGREAIGRELSAYDSDPAKWPTLGSSDSLRLVPRPIQGKGRR
jgi:hypothetical protein